MADDDEIAAFVNEVKRHLTSDQRESGRQVDLTFRGHKLKLHDSLSKWSLRYDGNEIATSYKAIPNAVAELESGSGGGGGGGGDDSDSDDDDTVPPPPAGAAILVLPPLEVPFKQAGINKVKKALAGDGGEYPREIGINGTGAESIVLNVQSTEHIALMIGDSAAVDVKIYPDFEVTLGAIELVVRYALLDFQETSVDSTDATALTAADGSVHELCQHGSTWIAGAPAVGAQVEIADESTESQWAQHIVQSVAKKTFKVMGSITSVKIEEYGDSWRYPVAVVEKHAGSSSKQPLKPALKQSSVATASSSVLPPDGSNDDSISSLLTRLDDQIKSVDTETEEMVEYSKVYGEIERVHKDASKERVSYLVAKFFAAHPIDVSSSIRERTAPLQTAREELARAAAAAIEALGAPPQAKKQKKAPKVD